MLNKPKKSIFEISREKSRSCAVIAKYIKEYSNFGKKKSPGYPKRSFRARSKLIYFASGKNITANNLKHALDLNVHKSTITRTLARDSKLKRKNSRKFALNFGHLKNKILFSDKYTNFGTRCKEEIFSDKEKAKS